MIRIQIGCQTCGQIVDGTFAAGKIPAVAEWFNTQHLYPKCMEETDGRAQEGEPAAGEADAGNGGEGEATPSAVPGRAEAKH